MKLCLLLIQMLGIMLMLVMQGYKANAKNTNMGAKKIILQ